jgi:hypothetical protein
MGTAVTFYMGRAALEARIGVPGVMSILLPAPCMCCYWDKLGRCLPRKVID